MMEKVLYFKITYMKGIRYYPIFGSVRTVNFTCDVYANDSLHGVCFPTVHSKHITFSRIFDEFEDWIDKSVPRVAVWHHKALPSTDLSICPEGSCLAS